MSDPAPYNTAVDSLESDGLRLSAPWMRWFNYLSGMLTFVVNYTQNNKKVAVDGFSYTYTDGQQLFQLVPAGVLATGAITMAPSPVNGQLAEVYTTQTVTAFALAANAGQTIMNAPTTLLAGTGVEYYYNAADATWYRRR